jgi:hypothetical protein
MKIKGLLVILVAVVFLFSVSCKEKEDEATEKAEIKAKAEKVEKAEGKEAVAKEEKGEKEEDEEKEEEEEKGEKADAGEKGEKAEAAEGKQAAVDLKILPEAVLSAFKTAYPNAVIKGTAKEVENGVTLFEIESLDGKFGRNIIYSTDGKVAEIEESIAPADLPAAVQQTLAKEFPVFKILTAETLTKGAVKQFELSIQVKDKKIGVTINPTGKITEKSGEEKKAEAPVKK